MTDTGHDGALCRDMPWQDWTCILELGRHVTIDARSWLETYSLQDESTAVFLSGRVGLRPITEEIDDGKDIISRAAPAIIELPDGDEISEAHWITEKSSIYFFNPSQLQRAFGKSAQFASNFVQILQYQTALAMNSLGKPDGGLKRLGASLLARLDSNGLSGQKLLVTQSQLAAETGLSRQWVNRLLKQLEYQGIAELGRGHVFLRAPAELEFKLH